MYKFSKLGVSFNYNAGQTLAENRDRYLNELHRAVSNMDLNNADQVSIMKDLIKPKSMQTLFMANDEQFEKQMAWGDKWRVLSRDKDDLQNAQDLITVEMEWKQTVKDFKVQLMPLLTDVLNALKPVIPVIKEKITQMGEWIDKNGDKIAKYVEDGINWLINDFPEMVKDILTILKAIGAALLPIVEWVGGKLGNTWKGIKEVGGAVWANLVGKEDANKRYGETQDKLVNGEYGYVSDIYNWLDNVVFPREKLQPSQNITNNNGNTYTFKAGTHTFDKDTTLGGGQPYHYASSVKG